MVRIESYTCNDHLISPRSKPIPERTLPEMRLGLEVDNRVVVTDEYVRVFAREKPYGIGVIIKFEDRYSWESHHSTALVKFSCGCIRWLEVSWLELSIE